MTQIRVISFVSKKRINMYLLKAINLCCLWGITSLYIQFFRLCQNKSDDYFYLYTRNLESLGLKVCLSVQNIHLNLWGQVKIFKRIYCSRKKSVESAYLRFLMFKYNLLFSFNLDHCFFHCLHLYFFHTLNNQNVKFLILIEQLICLQANN